MDTSPAPPPGEPSKTRREWNIIDGILVVALAVNLALVALMVKLALGK